MVECKSEELGGEDLLLPNGLWLAATAVGFVYIMPFLLARRPVAIRAQRLAVMGLIVLVLRLVWIAAGFKLKGLLDVTLLVATLLGTVGLVLWRHAWITRSGLDEFREQVESACRGLFLVFEEPVRGHFLLTDKGNTHTLQALSLTSRMQVVLLPSHTRRSKVALLESWLSRQYPGPFPRMSIQLKSRE